MLGAPSKRQILYYIFHVLGLCLFFMTLLPSRAVRQGGAGQNWGQELQLVHPTNLPLPWLTVICAHFPPSHTGHPEGVECDQHQAALSSHHGGPLECMHDGGQPRLSGLILGCSARPRMSGLMPIVTLGRKLSQRCGEANHAIFSGHFAAQPPFIAMTHVP